MEQTRMGSSLTLIWKSSIGKKVLMAVTGLMWSGFVFAHMLGNLLIFVGPDAYNKYGHAIVSNPLYPIATPTLLLVLFVHVFVAIKLSAENRAARSSRYAVEPQGAKSSTLAQKSMIYTGSLLLFFIVSHLATFKYGTVYTTVVDGVQMRDLARLMVEVFQSPMYVLWYCVSLVLLGLHLTHGVSSMFQSLGFFHAKYTPAIKTLGWAYGVVVAAGFLSQPLYVFFGM